MTFNVKTLYPTEKVEGIVTALLTVIALKSFECILKALLISAGKERVSTSQYALSVAVDQAWNPLNYITWIRGRPDFQARADLAKDSRGRRKIPLQRATIAILIMLLALIAEAAFFWGTQTKRVGLTDNMLQIAVNHTNRNHETKLTLNGCEPIVLEEGRGHLQAVFAACNSQDGTMATPAVGSSITARILQNEYAVGVGITGAQNVTSWAKFTLLMQKKTNLVARLSGEVQELPSTEVIEHYQSLGCAVVKSPDVNTLVLNNCRDRVDPFEVLQIIVAHIAVWQDGPAGDVGAPAGNRISVSPGDHLVGVIMLQNFTAVAILAISMSLLALSVICNLFVKDDTLEVIGCMLREKTGQDPTTPTCAMGEGEVRIKRSFSEETQEWYIGTIVPDGYEERTT